MTADRSYAEPLLDLQRLVAGIRWRRRLWLPMAELGLLIGIALAVVAPPQPVASVKVLVLHEEDQPNDGGALIATDIALLQTNRIAEQVLKKVGSTDKPEDFVEQYSGIPLSNNVMEITVEADTAEQALARLPALRPDVAVLDVRLPDGDGVSVCRELRSRLPNLNCLMLTSYPDEQAMMDAILAGARGYVIKDIRGMDLVSAVRTAGAGHSLLDMQK